MDAEKFGAFIAGARKEKNMTQKALAERLHVTDKAVSRWERGLGYPDIHTLEPLAAALGVGLLELLHGERSENGPDARGDRAASDAVGFFKAAYGARIRQSRLYEQAALRAMQAVGAVFLICSVFFRAQLQARVPLWLVIAAAALELPLLALYLCLRRKNGR